MSSILTVGRSIMALLQPMTGARATGQCLFRPVAIGSPGAPGYVPAPATVQVPPHVYLSPLVNGQYRPDLAFKIPQNPATIDSKGHGGEWTVSAGGTELPIISNIGGTRYNVAAGTKFRIEPDIGGSVSGEVVAPADFTGGTNLPESPNPELADLALHNAVLYETFGGNDSLELFASNIGGKFPAVILFWDSDEPADGMTTSDVNRPTKRGSGAMQYAVDFELWLVVSRSENEAQRRGQAMRLLDEISVNLYDRMAVDGLVFSSPGGLHIKRRSREAGNGENFFKAYRVYSIGLSATVTLQKRDLRAPPAPLVRFSADYLQYDPDGQHLPMLHDIKYSNPQP